MTGAATAADIETLGETVRRRVADVSGVTLEWEIKRVGLPAPCMLETTLTLRRGRATNRR